MTVMTLKGLINSFEFHYLETYDFNCSRSFDSRNHAYRVSLFMADIGVPKCKYHVCYNPAISLYTIVNDSDFKEFKRCSSYVKKCYNYFERIGIL